MLHESGGAYHRVGERDCARRPLDLPCRPRHSGSVSCGFETVDVYGVPVSCSHDTWDGHVLGNHPMLAGFQRLAAEALVNPVAVYDSGRRSNRRLFYGEAAQPLPFQERYLLVVAAYDHTLAGTVGVVVTAYPVDDFLDGDILVWQR